MSNFAPNLSTGPCLYCDGMAKIGPEDMLRCELCRQTAHISCLKSGIPDGRLLGDNFFSFTCSLCQQNDQDSTVRAKLNTPQLLLLVLYNLHMSKTQTSRSGYFHWKMHIYSYINQHWKEIFGPERHKKKKKALQASLSGQLSHYGQYFVSGYETLQDGGWYKLSMVLPPAQLIQQYTAEKSKGSTTKPIKEEIGEVFIKEEELVIEGEPHATGDVSFDSNSHDDSSQGSWFMEKDILRPHSHPPLTLFDSEEENEESRPDKIFVEDDLSLRIPEPPTELPIIDDTIVSSTSSLTASTSIPTPSPTPSTSGKSATKRKHYNIDDLIEIAVSKLSKPEEEKDEFMSFGVVVGKKLKAMDKLQATIAMKVISDALFMGTLNKLEHNSQIMNIEQHFNAMQ